MDNQQLAKVERKVWNSLRILRATDPSNDVYAEIEQQYEKLANLIASYGGRIHGSQFHGAIAVYFELPVENKEAFIKEENIT